MAQQYLAIDLGSYNIKALVGEEVNNGWRVLLPIIRKSRGIKGGEIENIELVGEELENLLKELGTLLKGTRFRSAIIGINSSKIGVHPSIGTAVVSRADGVITEDDKERALKTAQAYALSPNRILIQTVLKNFIIDGTTKIKNPVGLNGLKLEAETLLLDVFSPIMKDLDELKEYLGVNFSPRMVLTYAGSDFAASLKDKEVGVLCLDLGASTTGMAVYENGELLDLKIIPLGGNHITNDIAIGLKTSLDSAEEIKIKEGIALTKKVNRGESFDLSDYFEEAEKGTKISKRELAYIIEARISEIFDKAIERLKELGRFQKLPAGVILYGGGAKMNFIKELAKEKFKLPVKMAKPENDWYLENQDPTFIPALGLMELTVKLKETKSSSQISFIDNLFNAFRKIFNW